MDYRISYPFGVDLTIQTYHNRGANTIVKHSSLDLIGIKQHKITTINEDQLKDYGRNLNKIKESRSLASLGEGGDSVRFGVNSKVMQNLLCQNYQQQIKTKQQQKRRSAKRKIMEERDYLSHFEQHKQFQRSRKQQIKQQYKTELQTEIKQQRFKYQSAKTQQIQREKKEILPRKNGMIHKSQAFQQFYQKAYQQREKISQDYLQYMKHQRKSKSKPNEYNPQKRHELIRGMTNLQRSSKERQKEYLRLSLDRQLKEQISKKHNYFVQPRSKQKINEKQIQFTNKYNPISNPIDLKMDRNNRYVIQQLVRSKQVLHH